VPQWVFYLVAMLFDAGTFVISSFYLIKSADGISGFVDFSCNKCQTVAHLNLRSMSAMVKMCVMD